MIRHAFALIWNRKRQNGLVLLELVGSLLILLILFTSALELHGSWRRDVGFKAENLWTVTGQASDVGAESPPDLGRRLLEAAGEHPAVETAGLMYFGLYTDAGLRSSRVLENGSFVLAEHVPASPEIADALGLELVEGRFYDEGDREAAQAPAVVNRALAKTYFGAREDPIGQTIELGREPSRVIGVVETFRKAGELQPETPMFFTPLWPGESLRFALATVALRMSPETPLAAQEEIIDRLRAEAPTWSFDIVRVGEQRRAHLERGTTPLAAGAMVALFLLLMVGLGLTGVLWQNISRRVPEIGLRRAQGATAEDIRRQIGLELLVLTLLSLFLGGLLAAQLPLLGLVEVELAVAVKAFALASVALVLVTAICGLYPGWLASRIQPAQALHHS